MFAAGGKWRFSHGHKNRSLKIEIVIDEPDHFPGSGFAERGHVQRIDRQDVGGIEIFPKPRDRSRLAGLAKEPKEFACSHRQDLASQPIGKRARQNSLANSRCAIKNQRKAPIHFSEPGNPFVVPMTKQRIGRIGKIAMKRLRCRPAPVPRTGNNRRRKREREQGWRLGGQEKNRVKRQNGGEKNQPGEGALDDRKDAPNPGPNSTSFPPRPRGPGR